MLKDDRTMSMLTFLVIMVAVGTMVQRMDVFQKYFNGETAELALVRDEAILRANTLSTIDVLANDTGLSEGDAEKLIVVQQPDCGRVFARDGVAQYLPAERCVGAQTFRYAISGRSREQTGEVVVTVRLAELTQTIVAADAQRDIPAPAPQTPRATEQASTGSAAAPAAPPAPEGEQSLVAAVQAPSVPKPAAPTIDGLPSQTAASASNGDVASLPSIALPSDPEAPSLTEQAGGATATDIGTGTSSTFVRPSVRIVDSSRDTSPDPTQPAPGAAEDNAGDNAGHNRAQEPQTGTGGDQTIALARVEPAAPLAQQPLDAAVPSAEPQSLGASTVGADDGNAPSESGSDAQATGERSPDEALAALRQRDTTLTPVDTTAPAELTDPTIRPAAPQAATPQAATPGQDGDGIETASTQPATEPCVIPPSLTLDMRAAAITYLIIESPCHVNTIAELSYEGLRFAIPIDTAGTGTIAAAGFQHASDAKLLFADGDRLAFNMPFNDTEKMDRVALASEIAAELHLHAFEFGAAPGSPGHVSQGNPRHHGEVRRTGGGYMLEYAPLDGVGQAINVYTFWHRRGAGTGVVKLDLGLGRGAAGTGSCTLGATSGRPDYVVVRAHGGKLVRPRFGVLAPLDCSALAAGGGGFVADAIDDIIIRKR